MDASAAEAVRDDPVVRRWSGLAHEGASAWVARQIAKPDGVSLAVTVPEDDRAVGKAALGHYNATTRTAELSYWLVPEARGRGLASAACRTLTAWGFQVVKLDAIALDIEPDNAASRAVARRLGAVTTDAPPRPETDRAGVTRWLVLWQLRANGEPVGP